MYYILSVLIVLACLALIFLVIIQKSKGGGLATNLTGGAAMANQMGVRKATDFVERATWSMIGILAGLTLIANIFLSSGESGTSQRQQGPRFETSKALQSAGSQGMSSDQINPVAPQQGQGQRGQQGKPGQSQKQSPGGGSGSGASGQGKPSNSPSPEGN